MIRNQNKIFALGRLKTGEMNKTEKAYSIHLAGLMHIGEIVFWKFEGIKFRLANNTFLTPDFIIMKPSGEIQILEVKGYMMDDANIKLKVAAEMYPFRFFVIRKCRKKDGGGWSSQEI